MENKRKDKWSTRNPLVTDRERAPELPLSQVKSVRSTQLLFDSLSNSSFVSSQSEEGQVQEQTQTLFPSLPLPESSYDPSLIGPLKRGRQPTLSKDEKLFRKRQRARRVSEERSKKSKLFQQAYKDIIQELNDNKTVCTLCTKTRPISEIWTVKPLVYGDQRFRMTSFTQYWARSYETIEDFKEYAKSTECYNLCKPCYTKLNKNQQ